MVKPETAAVSRRQLIRYASVLGFASLAGCSSPPTANSQTEVKTESLDAETIEQKIFDVVNLERRTRGIEPLILDGERSSFAREHSQDMVQKEYLGTTDANGNDPGERVRAAHGFEYISIPLDNGRHRITGISENVGRLPPEGTNSATADAFVNFWMGAQESRRTMLDKYYDHDLVGIGCVEDNGQYVCTLDMYRLTTKKKSVAATPEPTPTATPEPTPTATSEPTQTATPEPTPTPKPAPKPKPSSVRTPMAAEGCIADSGNILYTSNKTVEIERKMIQYINEDRRGAGLSIVRCDDWGSGAARENSVQLASVGSPISFGTPGASIRYRGTNNSSGFIARTFINELKKSPKDLVMHPYISAVGVGVAYDQYSRNYWGTLYSA